MTDVKPVYIMFAMSDASVSEVVRAYLAAHGVELPAKICTNLVQLVLDTKSIPSYIEPELTEPMPAPVLARVITLSKVA